MWAPADLFTPALNAISLALKRAATFGWNHLLFETIALAALIAIGVAVKQIRAGRDRRD